MQELLLKMYDIVEDFKKSTIFQRYIILEKELNKTLEMELCELKRLNDLYNTLNVSIKQLCVQDKKHYLDLKNKIFSNPLMLEYLTSREEIDQILTKFSNEINESISRFIDLQTPYGIILKKGSTCNVKGNNK